MRRKVSIIGAGNVGASAAERIVQRRLADVVMVDIIEGLPQGKALDLNEAGPVDGYDFRLAGSNGYEETRDSDVVVITSGLPRKPGMSRDDLLQKNSEIVKGVTQQVARHSPRAVLIVEGMQAAIRTKRVTYDLARHMEGAVTVKTSEFADVVIAKIEEGS